MSYWCSKSVGLWSLEQEPAESKIIAEVREAPSKHEATMALEAPPEQEDSDAEFPPKSFQSEIRKSDLEKIQTKYQVPPEFELEVSLETDRACNSPQGRIALYEIFLGQVKATLICFLC